MSLVISHVGWDYVTIGADRGTWRTQANGVPYEAPTVLHRSKIHQVPGVPVVIATVGAWYEGWIEEWIATHPLNPTGYSLPDYAQAFINDYFNHHDPEAKKRLAEVGLTLPQTLEPNTPERLAASAGVIIAGLQPNWPRAQLWTADYPNRERQPAHYEVAHDDKGNVQRIDVASLFTMGNFDPLRPFIETVNANMTAEQSAKIVYSILDVRERLGRTETPIPCLAPFDIVRLTKDGIEWLNGSERDVCDQPDEVHSEKYVVAFNAQGSFKNTQSMKSMAVSVPIVSSSGITYTSSTGSSQTGSSTIELFWDGTNGSVVPQVHFPSDAVGTWTTCTAGNSGAITGLNASTTYYYAARIAAATLTVQVQQQAGGATANAADHAWLNSDGFIAFAVNMACSTPAVNSSGGGTPPGGGGGGTSCPATDQILETQRGFVKAGEIEERDFVRDPDGGWNEVIFAENYPAQIVAVTVGGEELRVDSAHLWLNPDGEWLNTMDLHLGTMLQGADKSLKAVEGLHLIGPGTMRKLKVERQRFVIGAVVGHNATTL